MFYWCLVISLHFDIAKHCTEKHNSLQSCQETGLYISNKAVNVSRTLRHCFLEMMTAVNTSTYWENGSRKVEKYLASHKYFCCTPAPFTVFKTRLTEFRLELMGAFAFVIHGSDQEGLAIREIIYLKGLCGVLTANVIQRYVWCVFLRSNQCFTMAEHL